MANRPPKELILPSKVEFEALEKSLSFYIKQKKYSRPSNDDSVISHSVREYFEKILRIKEKCTKELISLHAYKWLTTEQNEANFNNAINHLTNSFDSANINSIDTITLNIVKSTGLGKTNNKKLFESNENALTTIKFSQVRELSFEKRLNENIKKISDSLWRREKIILYLSICLKDLFYPPSKLNKEDHLTTEDSKQKRSYIKENLKDGNIKKGIENVIKKLEVAKLALKEIEVHAEASYFGYGLAMRHIDSSINILHGSRPKIYIQKKGVLINFRRFMVKLIGYLLADSGISIGSSHKLSNIDLVGTDPLSDSINKNMKSNKNNVETPVAVLMNKSGDIIAIPMKSRSYVEEELKCRGLSLNEFRDELEEWDDEGGEYFKIDRSKFEYAVNDIVEFITNIFKFKDFEDKDVPRKDKIKEVVEYEIYKYAIEGVLIESNMLISKSNRPIHKNSNPIKKNRPVSIIKILESNVNPPLNTHLQIKKQSMLLNNPKKNEAEQDPLSSIGKAILVVI